MRDTQTSPEIIALLLLAAAFTLAAWWLSDRQSRRFRGLIDWIKEQHPERWQALPWASREFNRAGGVEYLRRHGLGADPEFAARYQHARRVRWPQLVALLCGAGAIALVAIGIEFLGWSF